MFGAGSHLSWRAVVSGIHPSSLWPPHLSVQGQRSGQRRRYCTVWCAGCTLCQIYCLCQCCFHFWDLIESTRFSIFCHRRSTSAWVLKWSVQTGRLWRVETLIPEEDRGPNGCNRQNYNYTHAERRRKQHNKAHHWLPLTPPTADILSQRSRARGWGRGSQAMILPVGKDVDATYSRGWRNAPPASWP